MAKITEKRKQKWRRLLKIHEQWKAFKTPALNRSHDRIAYRVHGIEKKKHQPQSGSTTEVGPFRGFADRKHETKCKVPNTGGVLLKASAFVPRRLPCGTDIEWSKDEQQCRVAFYNGESEQYALLGNDPTLKIVRTTKGARELFQKFLS